jgi:uncharacterized membrane protein YphA (DoxX/SURF4 family)
MAGRIGFSVFRIMVGVTFLVGGYDKVFRLFASGFQDRWLGEWFVELVHGGMVSPQLSVLMPEFLLIAFGYVVPFWELTVGLCIVTGLYRMFGAIMGMALIAIFLIGGEATHAVDYPDMIIEIIQMHVFGFGYFFLYRELRKDPEDPLALDNLRLRSDRDRH